MLTIEKIKKLISPIFTKHDIKNAWLFGSYAKGTAHKDSDINLLIQYNMLMSPADVSIFQDVLDKIFGTIKVDITEFSSLTTKTSRFVDNVDKAKILIFSQ